MVQYKYIEGTDSVYASSDGEIVKFLNGSPGYSYSASKNNAGYWRIGLLYKGKRKHLLVHRMVAMAFHPKKRRCTTVNHIDGDKGNNRPSNLEWMTHTQNVRHAYKHGLAKGRPHKIITEETIKSVVLYFKNGSKPQDIAKRHGLNIQEVKKITGGYSPINRILAKYGDSGISYIIRNYKGQSGDRKAIIEDLGISHHDLKIVLTNF